MSEKTFDGGLQSGQDIALGIDQSLTGFALTAISCSDPSQQITWVYKSEYKGVERLADIRGWLQRKIYYLTVEQRCEITNVAMEGTVVASHAASALGELSAVVRLTFFDMFIEMNARYPLKVPPMTLKKYTTGKGNAKKNEMLLHVFKRWGMDFNGDDNAADSYSLSRLASGRADTQSDKAIIDKMSDAIYRD